MKAIKEICAQFEEQGYIGPVPMLSVPECRKFLQAAVMAMIKETPLDWGKGYAASSRVFYELGRHPALMQYVSALLGEDVMLWSAALIRRGAKAIHPWHSDIEAACTPEKTVSVWIGLEQISKKTSLQIIPYSHTFGKTIQEVRKVQGKGRDEASSKDVLFWAKKLDERCSLVTPDMKDGEALIFNGHLWHYSHNTSGKTRLAVVLQYAVPSAKIRIPDAKILDFPFKQYKYPKPGCVMVKGEDTAGVNRIVAPPVASNKTWCHKLTSRIDPFRIGLSPDNGSGFKSNPVFKGVTPGLESLSCHISVLNEGKSPHAPHKHKEEEIFLLLDGEIEIVLPDNADEEEQRQRIKAGECFYYPAGYTHTLKTVSKEPANYLMFKWHSHVRPTPEQLSFCKFDISKVLKSTKPKKGYAHTDVFAGPTGCLQQLSCHVTTIASGGGYEVHSDPYDVAIVLLEGEVETLAQRVGAHSVIFYPAGEEHGMSNPGKRAAKYIVFEFHPCPKISVRQLLNKISDPKCWGRKIKHTVSNLTTELLI